MAAIIGTVVAVVGLAFTIWTYQPPSSADVPDAAPAPAATHVSTPQSIPRPAAAPVAGSASVSVVDQPPAQPELRGRIVGRWYVHQPPRPVPERTTGSIGMTMAYDFREGDALVLNATLIMSEFAQGRQIEVTCTGLARGRWSLADRSLSLNLTENLMVAVAGARDAGVPLSGALAESKGFRCPDTPLVPANYAATDEILEITPEVMRVLERDPQGVEPVTYVRTLP